MVKIAPYMRKSVDKDKESRCLTVEAQLVAIEGRRYSRTGKGTP